MWKRVLGVVTILLAASWNAVQGQAPGAGSGWRSAQYYGGSDFEFAERMVVDDEGAAYLLGRTFSHDLDAAVIPLAAASGERASATFILKLDRDGRRVFAAPVGAGFSFLPLDIAVGRDGAAHVLARAGDEVHVIKLASNGSEAYHNTFSTVGRDPLIPAVIAVDDAGHAVIAGAAALGTFVARLDTRGAVFDIHVMPFAADVRDLAVDRAGDAYVAGAMYESTLPATAGVVQSHLNEGRCSDVLPPVDGPSAASPCPDAFLVKVTRGGAVAYATYFGGSGWDQATAVAVDANGSAVLAGLTRSIDMPTVRAAQPRCNPGFAPLPCGDAFVAKLDPSGASLLFSTYLGGSDAEGVSSVGTDDSGVTIVGGSITGSGLPVRRAPQPANGGGQSDGYVAAFGPGGELLWATYVGGAADERVVGVGAAGGMVYFGGETNSPGWAMGGDPHHGARDLFAARVFDPAR